MGKGRQTSNDLTLMGVVILKKRVRSDGHTIYLCKFPHNEYMWCVVDVDENGHISGAQCFFWSYNTNLKKKVQLYANRVFKEWKNNYG